MPKVLMVDDEPDIEFLAPQKFRTHISNGLFDLVFAKNGNDALDLVKQDSSIGVVVTDVSMPEMDGFTLIDHLKEIIPTPRVIIMSAFGDTATWRKAMNKGVFDFITKPVDFNDLGDAILRAFESPLSLVSPLHTYQLLLKKQFPKYIHLEDVEHESKVLWDTFPFSPKELIVTGLSLLSFSAPFEIEMGFVHGILRSFLQETPDLPISYFEEKFRARPSSLKAQFLIGKYDLSAHLFTYRANSDFHAQHARATKTVAISPLSATSLMPGDEVILEVSPSFSRLSIRYT